MAWRGTLTAEKSAHTSCSANLYKSDHSQWYWVHTVQDNDLHDHKRLWACEQPPTPQLWRECCCSILLYERSGILHLSMAFYLSNHTADGAWVFEHPPTSAVTSVYSAPVNLQGLLEAEAHEEHSGYTQWPQDWGEGGVHQTCHPAAPQVAEALVTCSTTHKSQHHILLLQIIIVDWFCSKLARN